MVLGYFRHMSELYWTADKKEFLQEEFKYRNLKAYNSKVV